MEYFKFIGAIIACILGVFKIFDLLKNRPILKKSGIGGYHFEDNSTEFNYIIVFENIGTRPLFIKDMHVDLLDNKKKRLNILSTVKDIDRKLDSPDVFQKSFNYVVKRKLPQKTYFIRCKIFAIGKKYTLKIKMRLDDEILAGVYEEIEKGKSKGLIE